MKDINKQTTTKNIATDKQRSYHEVVEFLDAHWATNVDDKNLKCMKELDKALESPSQKLNTISVAGSNGKSITINFAAKLLKEEGLSVGTFYSPHLLTYNERFCINNETISNKTFTELGDEIINTAESLGLKPHSFEILTMMALLYFKNNNADVALLEAYQGKASDATNICTPKIIAVTRVTLDNATPQITEARIKEILNIVKAQTHVIAADQSKLNLQTMQTVTQEKGGTWAMPIRKLAPLVYPFEQLHGRCAALAERIAHIYVNTFWNKEALVVTETLLAKQKGQRGRPTLEAKRQSELNPKRTVEQFWKETLNSLPGRFQLLDKEKPSILLDNASNFDALQNLLLGIRLLHYQRPLKGLAIVIGCNNEDLVITEFLKLLRYFFKKTSGQVIICPTNEIPGHKGGKSWAVEKVTNDIKSMKIKAKSSSNFKEAFEMAQKSVDERQGLVVITGSTSIINEYWRYKDIKKL